MLLIGDNEALALYEAAIDLAFANQADVKTSHIHTVIRRSLGGEDTDHINQVTILIEACRKDLQIQARSTIPL